MLPVCGIFSQKYLNTSEYLLHAGLHLSAVDYESPIICSYLESLQQSPVVLTDCNCVDNLFLSRLSAFVLTDFNCLNRPWFVSYWSLFSTQISDFGSIQQHIVKSSMPTSPCGVFSGLLRCSKYRTILNQPTLWIEAVEYVS